LSKCIAGGLYCYRRIHWTNCRPPYSWQMGKKC
jgi:hypothetical protein